ncbi:GIY-YIG nuclease family protein [Zoogloea sp.]|uniref:GIY-YIG nuclease family protein n=1 Tax=Zoogloea sp. TaxID=49181 RepID=UPI0025E45C42|nr:GIY-YIG nuclease family protein [Zoogloea sp.]MCK6393070.1 GIY-YIG nuclease family protein [Zoogloea sp.]MCK6408466.1 GIY-YIG nuclease family protein [Thauera sp.]
MAAKKTLDELLSEEADSELLNVKPRQAKAIDTAARARAQFEEINAFVERNGFAPGKGGESRKVGVMERSLQARLRAYQDNPELAATLGEIDRHGLLSAAPKPEPKSLDELLDSDDPLLIDPNGGLFELRHAKGSPARPDMVSEREPCADFETFKPLFDKAAAELSSGVRRSVQFANEQEIEAGGFFILNGVMVYVAEVRDPHIRNGKRNARLRLIFDNGTEGQNLLRSLATQLYKDPNGRRISDPNAGPLFGSEKSVEVQPAQGQDRVTGVIYVVKSLSKLPEIARLDGSLFKIGFTTGNLETRLRGVEDDPTFLMAPVKPVMSYQAINLNANAFERLVHHFFGEARLDIEVKDRFGKAIKPREWFLLPLPIIEQAIPLIVDGSILRYRYDHRACAIVEASKA